MPTVPDQLLTKETVLPVMQLLLPLHWVTDSANKVKENKLWTCLLNKLFLAIKRDLKDALEDL